MTAVNGTSIDTITQESNTTVNHRHPVPITVAFGDGIGPEIMDATLRVITAAGADLALEKIQIGETVYAKGVTSGIEPEAWDSLRRTKVFLKAPITTPQGRGFKSMNVTVRKTLGLFANIRPCLAYAPYVATKHPNMDIVIIRENEEDLYGGIEHRQTDDVTQCLKLITRPGSERLIRYAFEYARRYGRSKVTTFTKDNIMKLTDGLFHRIFDEVASEYPDLESEHWIVDIGAAKLADTPSIFDVIVLPNLYGDILSDVAAEIAGSVGMAGSANIGTNTAMFEAIHGSAPLIARQNIANPSGLLLAAVQMLAYIGQGDVATRVHNAWLRTIEEGVHTYDIFDSSVSTERVGTKEFADAVIARLGEAPTTLASVSYPLHSEVITVKVSNHPPAHKELVGMDVFVQWRESVDALAKILEANSGPYLKLVMISNRGQKVYPDGAPETFCVDHWRCRFQAANLVSTVTYNQIIELLSRLVDAGLPFLKTEGLFTFDGQVGFTLGQGQ